MNAEEAAPDGASSEQHGHVPPGGDGGVAHRAAARPRPSAAGPSYRPPTRRPTTAVVLFDMGGVLVELGPLEDLLGLDLAAEDFWPAWLSSPTVRRFERGACDEEEFGVGLVAEMGLPLSAAEVVERFLRFPRGLFPGAVDLVHSVVEPVRTAILSNTNRLHWEHQVDAATIRGLCDRNFLSYEMGLVKPDPAIFDRIVRELGVDPGDILFLDDNQLNVDGAASVGINAHLARGIDEVRAILGGNGLLADGVTCTAAVAAADH